MSSWTDKWGAGLAVLIVLVWAISPAIGFPAALTLLTMAGLLLALAGLASPRLGLLGFGLTATLDSLARSLLLTGGLLRFNTFNYVLLVSAALYFPALMRSADIQTRLLFAFLALLCLQLTYSQNPEMGLQEVLNVAAGLGVIVYFRRAGLDRRLWLWMAVLNAGCSAFAGLSYFGLQEISSVNPNAWALMPLTALFSITVAFRMAESPRVIGLLLGLASVNAGWVLLSGSRGAMVLTTIQMLYLLVSLRSHTAKAALVAGLAASLALCSVVFPNLASYAFHRVEIIFDEDRTVANRTSGRSNLMRVGVELFKDNPLGIGTGGFSTGYVRFRGEESLLPAIEKQAHSGWVKVLAENGIAGMALLIWFVISFAATGWRSRCQGSWPIGLLTTVCIALALTTLEFQSKGIWLLVAASLLLLYSTEPEPARRTFRVLERIPWRAEYHEA